MMAATITAAIMATTIITKTKLFIVITPAPSLTLCIVVKTAPAAAVVAVVVIRASVVLVGPRKLVGLMGFFAIVKLLLGLGRAVVINAVAAVLTFVDVLFVVWGGVVVVVAEAVLVLRVKATVVLGLVVTAVVVRVLVFVAAVVVEVVVAVVVRSVFTRNSQKTRGYTKSTG